MTYNILIGLRTYGKRHKLNLKVIGCGLAALCFIPGLPLLAIPFILKKLNGVVYI